MGALMACGALVWCGLSFAFGFREAAAIPLGYIVLTAANFAAFGAWKRFAPTAFTQVLASVLLPFAFQWSVGGFYATGAAMLWALVAVVGSLTFTSPRELVKWLAVYLVLAVASGFVDGAARARTVVAVSDDVKVAFLVANIVMISTVTLLLIFYFLDQRERAVHALARATERIEDLRQEVADARQLGQYTLVAKLGSGAMGTVYLASHAMLRRPTAIKLVRREKVDEETLARFEREVQLTATLTHPNVITVYDYGRTDAGMFYYVMEYLGGADLGVIVERHGAMPAARCLRILVADGGRARRGAQAGPHPPRREAGERDPRQRVGARRGEGRGLRPGEAAGGAAVVGLPATGGERSLARRARRRGDHRDAGVHEPRGDRYAGQGRWPLGRLLRRLSGLLPHHREGGVHGEVVGGPLGAAPACAARSPSAHGGVEVPQPLEEIVLACLAKSPADRPSMAQLATRLRKLEAEARGEWSASDAAAWWEKHGPT